MSTLTYHLSVGKFDCYALADGMAVFGLDGLSNRFAPVAAADLRHALEALGESAENAGSYYNPLLIRSADNIILVDSGERADRHATAGQTPTCLHSLGIAPSDVDTIIITHAHGDHIVGFFEADNETLRYPNARYWIDPQEWAFWTDAAERERRGATSDMLKRLESRIAFIDINRPIVPGIMPLAAYGHTAGHICLSIESNGQQLVHGVDLVHSPVQFPHPDWCIRFDTDADTARATRLAMFEWLAREQITTLFYHMPFPGIGTVERTEQGYRWQPIG